MTIALTIPGNTPPHMSNFFKRFSALSLNLKVIMAWFIFITGNVLINGMPLLNNDWVPDNDDLMRLVQVRDLLAGQGWFDMMQHRLDPPGGGFMHWSRIADIGIAAPMFLLRQVINAELADALALTIYPALILLAFLFVMTQILRQLSGDEILLPALVGILTCWSVMQQMMPGRIDHHGLQILLIFIALAQVLKAKNLKSGLIAGISVALSLGIGLETLAYIAVLQLGLWGLWVRQLAYNNFVRGFGLGMIAGCALVVFATIAPALWLAPINDAFGRAHAGFLLLGGMIWIMLSMSTFTSLRQRYITSGVAGLLAIAFLVMICPEIIKAPYTNLDPYLKIWMMDNIGEAAPIWVFAVTQTMQAILYVAFLVSGLLSALYLTFSAPTSTARSRWLVITSLLLVASLIAMLQVRGFNFAHALALLPCTVLITHLRMRYTLRPIVIFSAWAFLTIPGLAFFCFSGRYIWTSFDANADDAKTALIENCTTRQTLTVLQSIPKSLILAPMDMGAPILAYTHHTVLAAPYHRVERGLKDMIMAYRATPEQARSRLAARQVKFVIYCKSTPETEIFQRNASYSLMAELDRGKIPAWLQSVPLPAGNALRLYRIKD